MAKINWRAKVLYVLFALALAIGLALVAAPQEATAVTPDEEETNTLRLFGRCTENAAFPYTDPNGPFAPQHFEAPAKDFIVWNPAYMYHLDPASAGVYGTFFRSIVVNGNDANEKVHLRQWYVPKYGEPTGLVWTNQAKVYAPEIVKEYTYLLLDTNNNPQPGLPGETRFVFPTTDNDDQQCGPDDYDMNNDGEADIVYLATTGAVDPDLSTSPIYTNPDDSPWGPSDGPIPQPWAGEDSEAAPRTAHDALWPPSEETLPGQPGVTIAGETRWIDINTGQFTVEQGDVVRYLDHTYEITGVSPGAITVKAWYSGNSDDDAPTSINVPAGMTLSRAGTWYTLRT
jgi:hypothetical protein